MDPLHLILLLVMGTLAGMINAAVGSGSLLTLPVLLTLGIPPGVAVRTNTIGILFSTIGAVYGFRREIRAEGRAVIPLVLVSAVLAATGSILLLLSPPGALEALVPILIVVALVLVIWQPSLTRWLAARRERREAESEAAVPAGNQRSPYSRPALIAPLGVAALYGGYFTAAQGILYMGIMAIGTGRTLARINPVKNLLALVVNLTAAIVYVVAFVAFDAEILWIGTLAIAVGALVGGYAGSHVAKRLPDVVLRGTIVVVALIALVRQVLG